MSPLALCPECQRHLRRTETTCPFCSADVREAFLKLLPRAIPTERLGRTALLAFAAANLGVAACGGEVGTPIYGAPWIAPDGSIGGSAGANTGGKKSGSGGSGSGTGGMQSGSGGSGSGTGGMQSGSGGRIMTGGAPGTGGLNTGGYIVPPYGFPGIPPEPPSAGGQSSTGGAPNANTGGGTNTGGDCCVPIYGAAPPKP